MYVWLKVHISRVNSVTKGGDKYNPDNYRAISLGSCLGKLFSNLLLGRIQAFRSANCPDTPNVQNSDHIFSLKTIIDKYL